MFDLLMPSDSNYDEIKTFWIARFRDYFLCFFFF